MAKKILIREADLEYQATIKLALSDKDHEAEIIIGETFFLRKIGDQYFIINMDGAKGWQFRITKQTFDHVAQRHTPIDHEVELINPVEVLDQQEVKFIVRMINKATGMKILKQGVHDLTGNSASGVDSKTMAVIKKLLGQKLWRASNAANLLPKVVLYVTGYLQGSDDQLDDVKNILKTTPLPKAIQRSLGLTLEDTNDAISEDVEELAESYEDFIDTLNMVLGTNVNKKHLAIYINSKKQKVVDNALDKLLGEELHKAAGKDALDLARQLTGHLPKKRKFTRLVKDHPLDDDIKQALGGSAGFVVNSRKGIWPKPNKHTTVYGFIRLSNGKEFDLDGDIDVFLKAYKPKHPVEAITDIGIPAEESDITITDGTLEFSLTTVKQVNEYLKQFGKKPRKSKSTKAPPKQKQTKVVDLTEDTVEHALQLMLEVEAFHNVIDTLSRRPGTNKIQSTVHTKIRNHDKKLDALFSKHEELEDVLYQRRSYPEIQKLAAKINLDIGLDY